MSKPKQISSRWSSLKTQLITTTLGWIPLLPGLGLRYLIYPLIFQKMGKSVKFYPGVEVTDASLINIGFGVVICSGVVLNGGKANQIELKDLVRLDPDVRLSCSGEGGCLQLGKEVNLDRGVDVKVHQGSTITIGDRSYIGPYTCISGYSKIAIGKNCLIASHSSIYAHNHDFSDLSKPIRDQGFVAKGITIEDDCWLGSGVKVVDGVTIGKGSVISAGAVVMKDIPPYSVAAGVPAKIIAQRAGSDTAELVDEASAMELN